MPTVIADQLSGWSPAPTPAGLSVGAITPNVWNIVDAQGYSEMDNDGSTIHTTVSIKPSTLLNANLKPEAFEYPIPILAYSEIIYGANNYGAIVTAMAQELQFPMLVSQIMANNLSIHATTNMAVDNSILDTFKDFLQLNYYVDLLYDIWIKVDTSQRAVGSLDYELMILTLLRNSPYLGAPVAIYISNNTKLYGVPFPILWGVFVNKNPINNWTMIIWQPLFEQIFPLPNPNDLTISLAEMLTVSQQVLNVSLANYFVMGIEFGSEFGVGPTNAYNYKWSLSNYYFQTNSFLLKLI
jgi:hypothetical protein